MKKLIKFIEWLINYRFSKTTPPQNSPIFREFPMRWYDTCSCMAAKLPDTMVKGTVVREYYSQFDGISGRYKGNFTFLESLSIFKSWEVEPWWECKLENGKTLERPKRDFFKGADGIYEYCN